MKVDLEDQVSGMRYTIHNASHTVIDVEVLDEDGTYRPIDETRTYIVAVTESSDTAVQPVCY